nr:helix-turn-helix domain-containing protein [Neobacillus sp. Marseille-Q6967]
MLKKLIPLYKNSFILSELPEKRSEMIHYFFDVKANEWMGIPKSSITEKEVTLLKTLYELVEFHTHSNHTLAGKWYEFLFLNGPIPLSRFENKVRIIQFSIKNDAIDTSEIESALKGFFTDDVIIIWENDHNGMVIEENTKVSLTENELSSITDTIESDLYIKISFYLGKSLPVSEQLRDQFYQEREFFTLAKNIMENPALLNFEKVFPAIVAQNLSENLIQKLDKEMIQTFRDDPEIYVTIKVFLENNLNASMTAKKLYIHRNTLQYRIDKFAEKTGIPIKDFYSAFTVFLGCMLYEQDNLHKK